MTERYIVDVLFWTRSYDGDDWVTGEHRFVYENFDEAKAKADKPFNDDKGLIFSEVYSIIDNKREILYKKEWS